MRKLFILTYVLVLYAGSTLGQGLSQYNSPKEYEIAGIEVEGNQVVDKRFIIQLSGLFIGDRIQLPGEAFSNAIRKLWDQDLFADIQVYRTKIEGKKIWIKYVVKERKRLSKFRFLGIKKSDKEDLYESLNLYREKLITEDLILNSENIIRSYYRDKGYFFIDIESTVEPDNQRPNYNKVTFDISKNRKVRIDRIEVNGNEVFSDFKVRASMKETKERKRFKPFDQLHPLLFRSVKALFVKDTVKMLDLWIDHMTDRVNLNVFKNSKFLRSNYRDDKNLVLTKYQAEGYRDAKIVSDTLIKVSPSKIKLVLNVDEGQQYFIRNIEWVGNSKYSADTLSDILGMEKGDVYNKSLLNARLQMSPNGRDISALYMDKGYLFFQINPVEVLVEDNQVDLEIRMYEGDQARIDRITITGNTKTNQKVILREIRTEPGELFSRTDIMNTQRQLAALGIFDAEKLNVLPTPKPATGTVDIEYVVEETPSDQITLSGGWGAGQILGTLGLVFNNFSTKNVFKKGAWTPLPSGDGQKLSVQAQSSFGYRSFNLSFTEPWLGGKKPNALTISAWHTFWSQNRQSKFLKNSNNKDSTDANGNKVLNPNRDFIIINGGAVSLGTQLRWPDDFFSFIVEAAYQNYRLQNSRQFIFSDGRSNNLYLKFTLRRYTPDDPIYPTRSSQIKLSVQFTPLPLVTLGNDDVRDLTPAKKYEWLEYHKWKFTSEFFTTLAKAGKNKLVLRTKVGFGFLGAYNQDIGITPFERFSLGGSGLSGVQRFLAEEIIALRGYDDRSVFPPTENAVSNTGQPIVAKYTTELRFPLSLNPQAKIFVLGFAEAGNTWNKMRNFNPFEVKRSAGVGVRVFLPMFGLLGLDWGYRFDDVIAPIPRSQVHFTFGGNLGEL